MYGYEELTEIIGAYCSLIVAYRGYSEGTVVGDYGNELVVRLTSGKEIVVYRDEVIVYE
ncbi:MAG: ribonuclease P [Bacteroidaceae bacterium]|nr:ribonuclease P [Bacteroidaceae bacterium]